MLRLATTTSFESTGCWDRRSGRDGNDCALPLVVGSGGSCPRHGLAGGGFGEFHQSTAFHLLSHVGKGGLRSMKRIISLYRMGGKFAMNATKQDTLDR